MKNETTNYNIKIFTICIMLVIIIAILFDVASATAQEQSNSKDAFDEAFIDAALGLGELRDNFVYERTAIYDCEEQVLGYIFDYSGSNGEYGYAIAIATGNKVKITEFCPSGENPYEKVKGLPIYLKEMSYWERISTGYRSLTNDIELKEGELKDKIGKCYCSDGIGLNNSTKTVHYISKETKKYDVAVNVPIVYYSNTNVSCVPLAGAAIIQYFDRYCENLIENYTPGISLTPTLYLYKNVDEKIRGVAKTLEQDMSFNKSCGYTTSDFRKGMSLYCNRAGYNISYNSCMRDQKFDYEKAKNALTEDGFPLTVFVSEIEVSTVSEDENSDKYEMKYGIANHAMSVFGYKEINYTMDDGSKQDSKYLHVSTGFADMPNAYLNVNNNLKVDEAYIINIA